MPSIHPYLNYLGNCEDAFKLYKSLFGGEYSYISRFGEMPPQDGMEVPEEKKNQIMHVSLPINEHITLMGSDVGFGWESKTIVGNNISVSITADTKEQAEQFFSGLSEGGQVIMPMADTFWGDYFGMLVDPFGINWMVSYNADA